MYGRSARDITESRKSFSLWWVINDIFDRPKTKSRMIHHVFAPSRVTTPSLLHSQAPHLRSLTLYFAPKVVDGGLEGVKTPADKLTLFWEAISKAISSAAVEQKGGFLTLSELLFAVVSGSFVNEQVFSALECVESALSGHLDTEHLQV